MFDINNHVQNSCGSASERFFKRGPRTILPNSINREIEHRNLIKARHQKQERIEKEKGRTSKDSFRVGDRVVLQNPITKRWTDYGEVKLQRTADDGSHQSFEITLDSGSSALRNKRFMKHEAQRPIRQVSFAPSPERSESARPRPRRTRTQATA